MSKLIKIISVRLTSDDLKNNLLPKFKKEIEKEKSNHSVNSKILELMRDYLQNKKLNNGKSTQH